MLCVHHQVLEKVSFDFIEAIEFVDDSTDGKFTPHADDWDATFFVEPRAGDVRRSGPVRIARTAPSNRGANCRDLLEFTPQERASYVVVARGVC